MIAKGKFLRIKHKKAQIVAGLLIGQQVDNALKTLRYVPKKAAKMIYKVLKSAVANATNNSKKESTDLVIKDVIVNKGPKIKRIRPVSRGRAHKITKGVAHVIVTLGEAKVQEETSKKEVKDSAKNKKTNQTNQ